VQVTKELGKPLSFYVRNSFMAYKKNHSLVCLCKIVFGSTATLASGVLFLAITEAGYAQTDVLEGSSSKAALTVPTVDCIKSCGVPNPAIEDPEAWKSSASFGLNIARGNADASLFTGTVHSQKETDSDVYVADIIGAQGEQDDKDTGETIKTQEYVRGDGMWRHKLSEQNFAGFGVGALTDQIADLKYRVFLNPTIGRYFLKDPAKEYDLFFEVGPSYIFEKQGEESNSFLAPRIASGGNWQITKTAKVFEKIEALISTDDSNDILVNATAGIEAALSTQLALVLSVTDRFDNQPVPGIERNDVLVTSALKVLL
jgi:putative salt-induced outer membrane protein